MFWEILLFIYNWIWFYIKSWLEYYGYIEGKTIDNNFLNKYDDLLT